MKIIAFYLPQFHNIPENDEWWGKGFTEWTNVKKAYPLYKGHQQPRVPLNGNYYDLTDDNVKIWQAEIAKKYGIYAFCYYHYWFNGKLLLEKPMEQMLNNSEIDINYCICWANEPWTKAWIGNDRKILISQKYGDESEWKKHYEYLLPFFKDERYIKINNKPVFVVYRPKVIGCMKEMIDYWRKLSINNGFDGIVLMCATSDINISDKNYEICDNIIEWQPHTAKSYLMNKDKHNCFIETLKKCKRVVYKSIESIMGINPYTFDTLSQKKGEKFKRLKYDEVWKNIIDMEPLCDKSIPGAYVRWDNTPRYRENASIIEGETPQKFYGYMKKQIHKAKKEYKTDMIFLYAWNEWAEGGFMEPDEDNGYAYLEALKEALMDTNEFK